MRAGSHQAGNVGHVDHELGAVVVRDLREALKVDDARIGGGTRNDERGLVLLRLGGNVVVVDALGLRIKAVGNHVEELARIVGGRAMGEMTAVGEVHAHHHVTRLGKRELGSVVCLRTRVRLHVGKGAAKELLGTLARKFLNGVNGPAAAVIAFAGQTLGVLVGKNGANGLHDGQADKVL